VVGRIQPVPLVAGVIDRPHPRTILLSTATASSAPHLECPARRSAQAARRAKFRPLTETGAAGTRARQSDP
jgi:hypothetical protein